MTEAKRVTLTTISSTVSASLLTAGSSNLRFGADFMAEAEKPTIGSSSSGGKCSTRTIRLNVELFQTDSNKYPEFDYAKLMHLEKKKIKKLKQKSNGFSDPFEDNDDDVARIAKELEKKYGNAYSSGRGKNKRDDVDIGMGYDESDSFIDNTEAYDELIPDEVETIEGGFYINCGALEFKKLHTESYTTKTDEIIKMPNRPKKRVISSSSEESSSSGEDDEEEDDDSEDDGDEESGEESSVETSKSKSSASTNDKKSKSSSSSTSTSTSNPAKKKSLTSENGGSSKKTKEKHLTNMVTTSASSSPKVPAEERASDVERNVKKVEKTTTVKDMLKAQRDNFLKSQTSSNGDTKGKSSADDDDESSSDDSEDDDDNEEESDNNSDSNQSVTATSKDKKQSSSTEEQVNEKLRTTDTNLSEIDPDVLNSINEFRDSAKSNNLIGKKFQFDDKLSESFLKIDDSLLCLDKVQRNMVFAHLEFQLSLPKYYFLRKAKQLRIKEEKLKSKRTFNKLHKAITETMPAVIASYEAELRRYVELQAANPNSDHPPKMPKKKFPWNTNLRNLVYDVYQIRWTSYPVLGTRKETLEEFITNYMRDKVVDIWPKGWMRYEELQKEIEKRKTAAKKAKEKKKITSATTSGQSSPNTNVVNNPLNSIQIATVASLSGSAASSGISNATAGAQAVSYMKQFEEFTSRSNANSDTDSVASSSASLSLKRKNTDANRSKPSKPKTPKLNGDQTKVINNNNMNNNRNVPPTISVDLVSSSKRTDHSISHIMSPTERSASTSTGSSIFSATTAVVSQPSKHSTSTHVIDLDNYKSVGDILQTSKQLQAAANAAAISLTTHTATTSSISRCESSGDSEIEIVGIFPPKQQIKKTKNNSRSMTPNSNYANTEKTSISSSHHHHHHHHNNNNNNNSSNRKKGGNNSGLTSLPGMDVNKMVNTLMELGDELQIKPILNSTAQQQQQHTPSSSQGSGSHQ